MPVDGFGLATLGVGGLFVYAGIRGKSIPSAIQAFISGKSPSTATSANQLSGASVAAAGASSGSPSAANVPAGQGSYTQDQVKQLWIANGGPANTAQNASCHAMQESSGSSTVTSSNPDGGTNVGLFQLDTKGVGAGYTVAELQNPNLNTQITIMATHGGTNWSEWATPGC